MNIVIVGAGKVGYTLAKLLSREGQNVTVIDKRQERIALVSSTMDANCVSGAVDVSLLKLAGAQTADLLIAATDSDEANILCCMVARKLGVGNTIARVRQAEHFEEVVLLREEIGLSMTVNPEYIAAGEISRVLRFPSAAKVESFAKNQAELVEFTLAPKNPLCGMALNKLHGRYGRGILLCAVRRAGEVSIPDGDFVLQAGDNVTVVGAPRAVNDFFKAMEIFRRCVRRVMILGGGHTGMYLAKQLLDMGIHVKIIEKDAEKCDFIKDVLPRVNVVCGDGARPDLLAEEGLGDVDGFVALTGHDEVNLIVATYAMMEGAEKVITKVNEEHFVPLAVSFGLEEPVQPLLISAQVILRYVRAMENSAGTSGVKTLLRIVDGSLEALEFKADQDSRCLGVALRDLPIRRGVLLAAVIREGRCFIPGGDDMLQAGDSIIAVSKEPGMTCLDDILKK